MILLRSNEIGPAPGLMKPIREWAVWFLSPFGLHANLKDAIEKCQQADLDPEILIQPVAVALDEDGQYERR